MAGLDWGWNRSSCGNFENVSLVTHLNSLCHGGASLPWSSAMSLHHSASKKEGRTAIVKVYKSANEAINLGAFGLPVGSDVLVKHMRLQGNIHSHSAA